MQQITIRHYLLGLLFLVSVKPLLMAHGFSKGTLIAVNMGLHELEELCFEIAKDTKAHQVESFQLSSQQRMLCPIASVAQSDASCFCSIVVGDPVAVIACTPLQEFYVAHEQCWKPAHALRRGDRLLTAYGSTCEVHDMGFVKLPLHVYTLQIEETHIFAVTRHHIITHNIFLPQVVIGLSIPWGAGALGTVGGFFGPVTLAVGVVVGGIIGFMWKKCSRARVPAYQLILNSKCFDVDIKRQLLSYNESESSDGAVGAAIVPAGQEGAAEQEKEKKIDGAPKSQAQAIEDVLKATRPLPKTKSNLKQYAKEGGYQAAVKDFESLPLRDVYTQGEATIGTLPDGTRVNVRIESTYQAPTLDIQGKNIKVRYT